MNAMAESRFFSPTQYQQFETRFDDEHRILWGFMNAKPRPSFNPQLLSELRGFVNSLVEPLDGSGTWDKSSKSSTR